jgi:hypothetical protein
VDWIKIQDATICCIQETHLTGKEKYKFKVKGRKNIFQENRPRKQERVDILICDKTDVKPKLYNTKKAFHIWKDDITCALSISTQNFTKRKHYSK